MLFNSPVFIFIFLPVVVVAYYALGKRQSRAAVAALVVASLFFYAWWNPVYLALMLVSLGFNYATGSRLAKTAERGRGGRRKLLLVAGVAVNLGLLFYFKYFNFFIDSFNAAFETSFVFDKIVLPLAISFFTFQQITYLVDSYAGDTKVYDPLEYALFVTFFPQLIAGPIVHHGEMMPQFAERRTYRFRFENLSIGGTLFLLGLFKKVVIADNVALYATPVFHAAAHGTSLTFFEAWGGVLAYTFQLYFDFSGYSDMAIGLARMFGIRLPLNFNSPYKAASIIDFWRRWHMTLSRFLRDYLYITLGGNRRGRVRRHVNIMITMLLGGLWHGAGWTFVIWGGLHGVYLVINHMWRALTGGIELRSAALRAGAAWTARTLTFGAVVVGWVFFRSANFHTARELLASMGGAHGFMLPLVYKRYLGPLGGWLTGLGWRFEANTHLFRGAPELAWLGALLLVAWFAPNTQQLMRRYRPTLPTEKVPPMPAAWQWLAWRPRPQMALFVAAVAALSLLSLNHVSEFLYFQF